MNKSPLGQDVVRADAVLKVTGKAQYAAEVSVANPAYAVIVTSSVGKGKLTDMNVAAAEHLTGVLRVLTHLNAPRLPGAQTKQDPQDRLLQLLQGDEVLYNDQPVALVIADTLEHAQEAASAVECRYQAETPELLLTNDSSRLFTPKTAGPHGSADSQRGDVEGPLRSAPLRFERTYTTPMQNHNPMEMHGLTVVWHGPQNVTLYDTTQGIFGVRKKVAKVFGIPAENVRVISHYVGGGFGCKGTPWSHVMLAAMGAKATGRAVRLVLTRQQMFSLVGYRPATLQRIAVAADAQGKLIALRHEVVSETSRFDEFVEPAALQTRMLYSCPNVVTTHRLLRLDVPTPTFMRAPGLSTGTFALECAIDELAYEAKLDPLELRLRNYAERDEDERKPWSSKSLRECYSQAAQRFGWARRNSAPRSMRAGSRLIGWGMATATYPAHQSAASARAQLQNDGSVLVQAGTQDIGTGTYTIMAQVAADELGLPINRIRFELGDTQFPQTPISGGSQTAASTGSAVKRAAQALRRKLIAASVADTNSALHGVKPQDVNLTDGNLVSRAAPNKKESLAEFAQRNQKSVFMVQADVPVKPEREKYSTHGFGAQFVEVQFDEELQELRVLRCAAAFATGKILNPRTARSQFLGGIVWGIGFALQEHTVRDGRNGRVVTRDLADYHVPVHADIPEIEVIMIDENDPYVDDLGAKGIGEIGITGITAAVANAVFHATGRRIRDLPITIDKLL